MERFAHLVEKLYNKTKEGVLLENLYTDVLALQQEMQLALVKDSVSSTGKVNVQLPTCYIPKPPAPSFSPNFLVSEVEEEKIEIEKIEIEKIESEKVAVTETAAKSPVFALIDESDEEDETPDYYIKTSFKAAEEIQTPAPTTLVAVRETESAVTNFFVEAPLRDLKSAISLNEKFIFINELFRGEETTYERSISAIQNFANYAEADSWIKRELITKQGWNNDDENVVCFMELVKRRFAS